MSSGWRMILAVRCAAAILLGGTSFAADAAELPRHFFLELDIAIERGGMTGLLFDFGDGIWGENSAVASVPPGTAPQPVRLQLPTRPIRNLRFDPTTDDAEVLIAGMRLLGDRGEVLLRIDPKTLRPLHQIQSIVPEAGGVRIHPTPKADDPMLRLDLPPLQKRMHDAVNRPTVSRGIVILLGLVIGTLVLTTVIATWLALGRPAVLFGGAALFLVVFGARLALLDMFSRPVPFWDEWEGDVLYLLIPFTGGFLDWGVLMMQQWEHRILLTRVITLFGTVLNGEWDPRVAMTVSAGMFSATIALLGTALLATRRWMGVMAAGVLAGAASLPFDFNNLLWGGQTQMYGLVLLAICAIGLAAAPSVTPLIRVGALAGSLISLGTMGAGLVGPGCAAGICLVRCWLDREQRRAWVGLALIFFTAALLGVFLHGSSRAHVPLYATTLAQFHRAFVGVLAWPLPPHAAWAALIWLPWLVNGVLILWRRDASPLEWLAVGLGGWGLVNAFALGYARPYEGPPFDSRFFTPLAVGALGSFCGSVALALRAPTWKWSAVPWIAWGAVGAGLIGVGINGIAGARESRAARAEHDHRMRIFLSTGDRGPVVEKPPHHTGNDVADRLDSPLLQEILPAPYRRVLAARRSGAPAPPNEAGPVTLTVRTMMKAGPAIAVIGLIGGVWFLRRVRPNGVRPPEVSAPPRPTNTHDAAFADRACYVAAVAIPIAWLLIYNHLRRDGLVDEPGHFANIHHFLAEKPGWPEAMPMLPGYHFIVVSLWKLHPPIELLTLARGVTTMMALLGFAAFALTWRHLHGRPAGRMMLLLALLPLTQPFTGLVYTDVPALAFALVAIWAHVTGRPAFAALTLAGAVALRQTNLAWGGFLIAWEFLRDDAPRTAFLWRIRWQALLLAAAAALVIAAGRLTVGAQHGNEFKLNIATIHFGGILVLVLGLPLWVAHASSALRRVRQAYQQRPAVVTTAAALGLVVAATLAWRFSNAHIWNRELWWEGCTFTLLRNWPLVWIDGHGWLKALSGLNVVLMSVALALAFAGQRHRRALWLALAFGLLPALTNGLVEPRYFIPAAGVGLLFLEIGDADWRRLALWWALLSAIHAPFVTKALSLW